MFQCEYNRPKRCFIAIRTRNLSPCLWGTLSGARWGWLGDTSRKGGRGGMGDWRGKREEKRRGYTLIQTYTHTHTYTYKHTHTPQTFIFLSGCLSPHAYMRTWFSGIAWINRVSRLETRLRQPLAQIDMVLAVNNMFVCLFVF